MTIKEYKDNNYFGVEDDLTLTGPLKDIIRFDDGTYIGTYIDSNGIPQKKNFKTIDYI